MIHSQKCELRGRATLSHSQSHPLPRLGGFLARVLVRESLGRSELLTCELTLSSSQSLLAPAVFDS